MHPRLAMVSTGIRRDLLAPLQWLSKFELLHFYSKNVYGDLTADDFDATLHSYRSPLDLYRRLTAAHADVISSVEPFSFYTLPSLVAVTLAARKTHAALVIPTFENRPLDIKFGKLRAALLRFILQPIFARACLVLVPNQGARQNVLACGGAPEKIVRAMWGSWGVDPNEFYPRTTRQVELPPTVLFVGRLHPEKGVFVLAAAFANVRTQIPSARLVMVGDGPARAELTTRIGQLGLQNSIQLTGTIKNRNIAELFRDADVFCAPSLTTCKWAEQVGMSALQAMACGVPIVSTQSGAIPEYVPNGESGILVQENDAQALANAMIELLTNTERSIEMGQRGRAYACEHYDAQVNVARAEQLVMEHCLARRA